MHKVGIRIGIESYSSKNGRYVIPPNAYSLDPLAVMLKGTRPSGDVYADYAREFFVPKDAMILFRRACLRLRTSNAIWADLHSKWADLHSNETRSLVWFAAAILSLRDGHKLNCCDNLNRIPQLAGKEKMKKLIVDTVGRPFSERGKYNWTTSRALQGADVRENDLFQIPVGVW